MRSVQVPPATAGGINLKTVPQKLHFPPPTVAPYKVPLLSAVKKPSRKEPSLPPRNASITSSVPAPPSTPSGDSSNTVPQLKPPHPVPPPPHPAPYEVPLRCQS